MKLFKHAVCAAAIALAFAPTNAQGKGKMVPKIYMFGFSASFTDSIACFTDVQTVDSAWIDSKTGFLLGRDNYSLQLKNHMADNMSMPNRTCIVVFNKNKSKADKEYLKMKKLYASSKSRTKYDVRYINTDSFKFKGVDMSFVNNEEADEAKTQKMKPSKGGTRPPMNGESAPPEPRM